MCERCQGFVSVIAVVGTMNLVRCNTCAHQQFMRSQTKRGIVWRGNEYEKTVCAAGIIEVSQ